MTNTVPISEKLLDKMEHSQDTLQLYMEWIENEYQKNGRNGTFENVFSNISMTEAYIRTYIEILQDEAPYKWSEPTEAFEITDALGDFLYSIRHDKLLDGMQALGDAVSLIGIVLEDYT